MGPLGTWCLLLFRGSAYCDTSADGFGMFPHLRRRMSPQSTTADGQNVLRRTAAEFGRRLATCASHEHRSAQSQMCFFQTGWLLLPRLSLCGPAKIYAEGVWNW